MKKLILCMVGLTIFLGTSIAIAEDAIFLHIDGIEGESIDHIHTGDIEVLSWDWGVLQSGSLHSGGGGSKGKPTVQDLTLVKYVDKASANLLINCLQGKQFSEAVLTVRASGDTNAEYLVITMSPVIVTSIGTGGESQGLRTTENVTLNFSTIQYSYTPIVGGSLGKKTVVSYDISTGR